MAARRITTAILTMLLGAVVLTAPAHAATVEATIGGVVYQVDDEAPELGATVTGYTSDLPADLLLPSTVVLDGDVYPVTGIGDDAFLGNASLTSVTIPDSVAVIGHYAFSENISLGSVAIGNGMTTIGNSAFASNPAMTSVSFGDSVTTIEDNAFYGATALASVTIPDSVTTIGESAFHGNTALGSVTFGDSVTSIGESAFHGNTALTSVTIPDSVTTIGISAFRGNTALTSVIIGDSVTDIGNSAFHGNTALTSLVIGDSVTDIRVGAFYGNTALQSVIIPDSVIRIHDSAFSHNYSLRSVTIGKSVSQIDSFVFSNTGRIETIIFRGNAPYIYPFRPLVNSAQIPTMYFYEGATGFSTPLWTAGEKDYPTVMIESHTVTFDANGRGVTPDSIDVWDGETVSNPGDLTAPRHTFLGWFAAATGGTEVTFPYTVTEDVTLYAQWEVVPFTDVPESHPFYDEIMWGVGAGITGGYADGSFRPGANVTRQALAAFLFRADGVDDFVAPEESPFSDVATDHPFYTEIAWMSEDGISTGYADGTFRAGDSITRQAVAVFLFRAYGDPAYVAPATQAFTDVPTTHPFYTAISWMSEEGISTGYNDNTFKPGDNVTRQATMAFFARVLAPPV